VEVVQSHAVVSGEAMYMLNVPLKTPLVYPKPVRRESLARGPCGRLWTSSVGRVGQFTIKYGVVTEEMSYPSIGQIRGEDIPAVVAAGRAVWDSLYRTKRILRVRLSAL